MHPELGDLQSRIARQHITEPGIWFTSWGCSLRHLWSGSGYRRNRQHDPDHMTPMPLGMQAEHKSQPSSPGVSPIVAATPPSHLPGTILGGTTAMLNQCASCLYSIPRLPKLDEEQSSGSLSFITLITFLQDDTKKAQGRSKIIPYFNSSSEPSQYYHLSQAFSASFFKGCSMNSGPCDSLYKNSYSRALCFLDFPFHQHIQDFQQPQGICL